MSDQDQSIFDGDQPQQQTQQESLTSILVGEGKKYKTIDELAKAYMNADDFIEKLKSENNELRAKTVEAKTIDSVLERLSQQRTQKQDDTPVDTRSQGAAVSEADIAKLVEQTVTGLETQKQRQANIARADKLMREKFGDKAAEVLSNAAVTPELKKVYKDLAAVNPEQFVALFASQPQGTAQQADVSTVKTGVTAGNAGRANTPGAKEYYDNIRRTNPGLYYSQEFQSSMDKAVRANPNLYYGR